MDIKFIGFAGALAAFCRQHDATVGSAVDGYLGVWDVTEGDATIDGLVDRAESAESTAARPHRSFLRFRTFS